MSDPVVPPVSGHPLDVVVLAGGGSSRMGSDKALLERDGVRQVDVVVAALTTLGGHVILARGVRELDIDGTVEVADDPSVQGPLSGVLAGLAAATTQLVALVGVDLVSPHAGLLSGLADHVRERSLPGAAPLVADRLQPLHAVVRRDLLAALRAQASISGSLVRACLAVGVAAIPENTWRPWAPSAHPELDLDSRADLWRIRPGRLNGRQG